MLGTFLAGWHQGLSLEKNLKEVLQQVVQQHFAKD